MVLAEVEHHPNNSAFGRVDFFHEMVRHASNRLRIQDLLKRHPEIEEIEITRPIIIAGLPRTGTTNLLNIIAADTRLRSTPNWETQQPVPDNPEQRPRQDVEDPRLEKCRRESDAELKLLPLRGVLHSIHPEHIEEDSALQAPDFASTWEWRREVPNWVDYCLTHDWTPHYTYEKNVLKILQWYRPGERWILKSIRHFEELVPLVQTFPDATIVFTHRDPVAVIQSAATMVCYRARMYYTQVDPSWYIDYFRKRVHRWLDAHLRYRHLLPEEQTIDVCFDRLIQDEMSIIQQIYHKAGFALTDRARAEIESNPTQRARGFVPWNEGKVVVDLRADYGVEPASIRREFDYYFEALPVQVEVN
jgi:hypothetical protein